MTLETEARAYTDEDTPLTGFVAWDDARAEKRPGILVVHGGAGLDDHARNRARLVAERGFVAFACDMYGDVVASDRGRVMAQIAGLRSDPRRLCRRAAAGLAELAAHPKVDGRLAAIGYCFGGMTVLELARSGVELAGVVSVHGSLEAARPTQPGSIKTKVLVCHGALDPHVPTAQVTAFCDEMNGAGADWQLIVYGGAMHGFTHEDASKFPVPGVAYHAATDARSWLAIQTFFDELFGAVVVVRT